MDTSQFEVDDLTGLCKWPVLLNGDWSQWTDEPCAILFGETRGWESNNELQRKVGELLRSPEWPHLSPFWLGRSGFLILAPSYSPEQALLLAQWVNRELETVHFPRPPRGLQPSNDPRLTWGIAFAEVEGWDMPCTLQAAISPAQRAIREKRLGSINEAPAGWTPEQSNLFWVCSRRDELTELNSWQHTAAICSHYADEPIALLVGNVDRFKNICDWYGHGPSDIVLQMLAHVLRRFESNNVAIFRSGGDEFLVWVRGQSLERAKQLAEQINAQIRALEIPVPSSQDLISNVSLTWGVVAISPREVQLQRMLDKADELLAQAKCEQRGSVRSQYM